MTLNSIAWSFSNEVYTDIDKFNKEVTQYQTDIYQTDERWRPNEIVFQLPELYIQGVDNPTL